ncbi:MAG TPA: glycoside hydrolase family 15 protein [Mycetocola sp.]|jgi:GH15 family glucan-1,4-alpha-glucosidase|nr:glycoside hydrolase family 15 protein [Mycetocola sp.]
MPRPTTPVDSAVLADLATSSFELILSLQDSSGAYPASPDFSAYRDYSWFRDGAFIADGVSSFGGVESASRFFDWCSNVVLTHREWIGRIVAAAQAEHPLPDAGMLPTRFRFDGDPGNDGWWDFQLDGYGTWLWAVTEHARRHDLDLDRWQAAISLTVEYLVSSWHRPCFDWWEEHSEHVHVSTLGSVAAGLSAARNSGILHPDQDEAIAAAVSAITDTVQDRGVVDGHLTKWLGSTEVDGSLAALISPLGHVPANSALGRATIARVDNHLNVGGGVHRFRADTFYGGGQWPLLSCMLGLAFAAAGDPERARAQLVWAARTVTDSGFLPEQVDEHLLDPSFTDEWVDRWGTVATPLLWSHAMYIRLAVELGITPGVNR